MAEVPHFEVVDEFGRRIRYRDLWQHVELLLVCLAAAEPPAAARYREELSRAAASWTEDAGVVITREPVAGLPAPSVVVADRWGEIQHLVEMEASLEGAPEPAELRDWLRYLATRCPECEGEWP